ncbi:hypothetical protein [Acrocarpospora sp. B8E8]|uniref:anti-sigma factor family protein n=1 Tax=Acrocarpospora sp. B8E8 TaxID=3153572 RepID=UPI00325CF8E7
MADEHVRELLPELAADVAYGEERGAALRHVATCPACQGELDALASVVDEVVTLAPPEEPPAGFEAAILARIDVLAKRTPRRAVLRPAAVAAALAWSALCAGAVWQATAEDRQLAQTYRDTLAVANGRYLTAAVLYSGGDRVGHAFGYQGSPSWILVTIESGHVSGTYQIWLVTFDGRRVAAGSVTVTDGRGSAGTAIGVPIAQVARLELTRPGTPDMTARLGS